MGGLGRCRGRCPVLPATRVKEPTDRLRRLHHRTAPIKPTQVDVELPVGNGRSLGVLCAPLALSSSRRRPPRRVRRNPSACVAGRLDAAAARQCAAIVPPRAGPVGCCWPVAHRSARAPHLRAARIRSLDMASSPRGGLRPDGPRATPPTNSQPKGEQNEAATPLQKLHQRHSQPPDHLRTRPVPVRCAL
jgi:hypothetical protein